MQSPPAEWALGIGYLAVLDIIRARGRPHRRRRWTLAPHLPTMTEHTACPGCGAPAEIVDRYVYNGSPGPVEHIATVCAADRSHNYVQTV